MFRKDDEFDDVAQYKKQRENNYKSVDDDRFGKRDDYGFDDDYSQKPKQLKPKKTKYKKWNRTELPKKIGRFRIIGFILIALVTFSSHLFDALSDIANNNPTTDPTISTVIDYADYAKTSKKINAKEFVKEYKKAKKNIIEYDKDERKYISGDYNKSHNIKTDYLYTEYNSDYSITYLCLMDKSYDESYNLKEKVYICGTSYQAGEIEFPKDFMDAIKKNNSSYSDDYIYLNDYSLYNSKYDNIYYINGRYFSKEFCEYAKRWLETNSLK